MSVYAIRKTLLDGTPVNQWVQEKNHWVLERNLLDLLSSRWQENLPDLIKVTGEPEASEKGPTPYVRIDWIESSKCELRKLLLIILIFSKGRNTGPFCVISKTNWVTLETGFLCRLTPHPHPCRSSRPFVTMSTYTDKCRSETRLSNLRRTVDKTKYRKSTIYKTN